MWNRNETNIKDCLECRLVGGICISLIGAYLWAQAKRRKGLDRTGIQIISCGAFGLGIARMFNIIPSFSKGDEGS